MKLLPYLKQLLCAPHSWGAWVGARSRHPVTNDFRGTRQRTCMVCRKLESEFTTSVLTFDRLVQEAKSDR